MKRQVEDIRDERIIGGFAHGTDIWDSDAISQMNIIGANSAISAEIPLPENFSWRSATNVSHPFTVIQMRELGTALLLHKNECYQVSWNHKAAIDACQTLEALEAYDISAGWPEAVL